MTSDVTDKSLLRCTVKKSVHVAERLIVFASYNVVAITIIAIAAFGVLNILLPLLELASRLMAGIWSVLASIPWYYYAGAAAMAAIPMYSFLWCVARELTEEDWKSDSANTFALAFALALAPAPAIAFAPATLAAFALITAIAFALALVLITAIAIEPTCHITIWYYIFRFPGAAWHHYTKKVE